MPREFKDPLWPEPATKWPGGRRLAPLPAPPMPPGLRDEPPNEKEPWIVDPENRPAKVPKGDEKTGQKIGPAFTKAPRGEQRSWVNAAFQDLVRNPEKAFDTAQAMEGSVFDTDADKTIRGLSSGSVPSGVVVNPGHAVFQDLMKRAPKWAPSLQKMKQITEYTDAPASAFKRNVMGVTTGIKPGSLEDLASFARTGRALPGPVLRNTQDLQRLYSLNRLEPGSTLQTMRPTLSGAEKEVVPFHEGLHALYAKKFPTQTPDVSNQRAMELMSRALGRSGIHPVDQAATMLQYSKDPQHGLVEAIAQFLNQKAKHGMGVR